MEGRNVHLLNTSADSTRDRTYSVNPNRLRKGLIMDPKWRIISLSLMGVALVLLVVTTMSTDWRVDKESRIDVLVTHGLWRICRDITFGSTVDHKCLSSLSNDAPDWFQATRGFMLLAIFVGLIAFGLGVKTIYSIPVLKNKNARAPNASLAIPAVLMFLAAIFSMVGVSTFAVATHMEIGLYFPESLPATWGNSWAQVWAKRNSLPSDRPEDTDMVMDYGYSFALGWVGVVSSVASVVVNIVASGRAN